MDYNIGELAKLAGVTTRTLRHYDAIGLLKPEKVSESGYRVYGKKQVDTLQQIMILKELGMDLSKIKSAVSAPGYNRLKALNYHLRELKAQRKRLELLINNVEKTISAGKGMTAMTDKEKFEGMKKGMVEENEKKYGVEIRAKYGDKTIDGSNAKLMGMSKEKYEQMENLSREYLNNLKAAYTEGDPSGELAQLACAQHKQWLMFFWESYSKEAHKGLAQMYVEDERFKAYYDKEKPGTAEFFRDAIILYCKD